MQYDKYFSSFDFLHFEFFSSFCIYLPLGNWNKSKIWEKSQIFVNIAQGQRAITSLSIA